MKLKRLLAIKSGPVITIRPDQPIRDAVALLARHNIGALVVVSPGEEYPVGIISERDVIRRAADNEGVFSESVKDIMTADVITGLPQDDLYSVMHTMTERRFRHLPVMDQGKLIGIISIGDVMKAQRDAYRGEIDTLETQILADEV
ncbi:MAG TPA: CBS domain-containing protein [Candidatus Binatia bacterium]|jgi:CBS domain-containing protein|nr:CBS domain-containing protein [Candidatus Binatia bacterium]